MRLEDKKLSTEKEVSILDSNTAELSNTPRGTSSAPIVASLFDTLAKAESVPAKPEVGAAASGASKETSPQVLAA